MHDPPFYAPKFRGSKRQRLKNFSSHKWDGGSYVSESTKKEVIFCSQCGYDSQSTGSEWPCGARVPRLTGSEYLQDFADWLSEEGKT